MEPRTKRTLLGCAAGCGAVALLWVSGCVGFTVWLRAPGKLLEPQVLLDPEAVGYVETRLELDNPSTEALVAAAVELARSQQPPIDQPLAQLFFRWNLGRQERDLRRAFPARLVWTAYPAAGDIGDTESIASISIQRAGHQLLLADWIFERVIGRLPREAVLDHGGERVLRITEDRTADGGDEDPDLRLEQAGEPGEGGAAPYAPAEPGEFYLFLRGEGAFFATGERAVRRAIDLLDRPAAREGWGPTRLGGLLAELPSDRQLRGAALNPNGELVSLLQPVLDRPGSAGATIDREAWRRALERVEAASISGGFEPSGDVVLDLELHAPAGDRGEIEESLRGALAALAEEIELDWQARQTQRGVAASLRLREVPSLVREAIEERRGRVFAPASPTSKPDATTSGPAPEPDPASPPETGAGSSP